MQIDAPLRTIYRRNETAIFPSALIFAAFLTTCKWIA